VRLLLRNLQWLSLWEFRFVSEMKLSRGMLGTVGWSLIDPFLSGLRMPARHTVACQYITRYAPLSARLMGDHLSNTSMVLPSAKEQSQDELRYLEKIRSKARRQMLTRLS